LISTLGTNSKGRIQYDNPSNSLRLFSNYSATTSLVTTDSVTVSNIISQQNIKKNHSQLSTEMGYLSTVAEARIKLEKLYRATDKPNL
jgi:prenyltransferase beta subunit